MCVLDIQKPDMDVLKVSEGTLKNSSKGQLPCFVLRFSRVVKAISYTRNSQDKLWALRCGFDFLAQLCYVHVQAVRACVRLFSPDLFQEHLPGEDFAAMNNE